MTGLSAVGCSDLITNSPAEGGTALAPVRRGFECGTAPAEVPAGHGELLMSGGRGRGETPSGHGGEGWVLQPLHHWVDTDCVVKVHSTNKHCVCVSENAADVCWVCWNLEEHCCVCCAVPHHSSISH